MKRNTHWTLYLTVILSIFSANPIFADYLEMASEKIFTPGEKTYVTVGSNRTQKVGIRVYKLDTPKEYLLGLRGIHHPKVETKRKAAHFFQLKANLKNKLNRQWRIFVAGNFKYSMRKDLITGLGLESRRAIESRGGDFDLFPVLKGYKLLKKMDYRLKKGKRYWSYTKIPLGLKKKGVYLVEGVYKNKAAYTVVIISDISFVAKSYRTGRLVFVTHRKTGKPIKGAEIAIYKNKKRIKVGKTNSQGLFQYKSSKGEGNRVIIFAQKGKDFSLSDPYFYRGYYRPSGACYIYTSRPVYRPGQKVSFKAIVRELKGDIYQLPKKGNEVQIKVKDKAQKEIFNKYLKVNEFGTVNGQLKLKETSSLGNYVIEANYQNSKYTYYFKVDKYKKPEYEVKVKTDKKFYIKGDTIRATIKAKYFFGSPVSKGKVEYHVYRTRYTVPWYDTNYAWYYSSSEAGNYQYSRSQEVKSSRDIKLKPDGTVDIVIDTKKIDGKYRDRHSYYRYKEPDYRYRITATVVDQSRRHISGSSTILVTRSDHYLKVSTSRWLYEPNNPVDIQVIAKRFNGTLALKQKVQIRFYQESWEKVKGKYKYKEKLLGRKNGMTDSRGLFKTHYTPSKAMWLLVKASSTDKNGNKTSNSRYIYIYDDSGRSDNRGKGAISIIADKSSYKLGDRAKLVFNSPVKKGYLLVTCEASSIPLIKVIPIKRGRANLNLKLTDALTPNTWVNGTLVFNNKLYTARKEIIAPPVHKFINVKVISNKKQYKPGEKAQFKIIATNYKGKPVRSEVSLGVVDASVYSIAPERAVDIRKYFYNRKYNGVSTTSSLYFRFTGEFRDKKLMSLLKSKKTAALASGKDDETLKQPKIRKDFKDEILWLPSVVTNSKGEATVNFRFPDNLTRWRTTVRAVTKDTLVGNIVHKVLVRKNLLVRLALPRFYREKDKAIVSTIVHNYLKSPKKVHISLEGKGFKLINKGKKLVRIPRNGEVRIDWKIQAEKAGTATFVAKALTNEESDAVQKSIPILPHGLETIDQVVTELRQKQGKYIHNIIFKDNYIPNFSELKIDIAPSVVVAMNSALPYLVKEPYGCVEQTMSRFLPLVLVDDIMKKMTYKDDSLKEKIALYYKTGVQRLYHLQHSDGGWGWWTDDSTHPYMTAYALSGLLLAKQIGRHVKPDVLKKGVKSLQRQIQAKKLDNTTKVFMLRALTMAGKGDKKLTQSLFKARKKLNPYARGILIEILQRQGENLKAQVLMKRLVKEAIPDSIGVYWAGKDWHYNWQDDSEETTANVVRAIAFVDSDQAVVSKGIQWIMSQRRDTHWRSTKSTAIMIHALYDIAKRRKELAPNYTAKLYLNGNLYRSIQVGGSQQSLKSLSIRIPEKDLIRGINVVKIEKEGKGALYYSSAFKYYEKAKWFKSKDHGFSIRRKFYRLVKEKSGGEVRYRKVPIRDRVVSGDIILAELSVNLKKKGREYVLVEDLLPSGCEVIKQDRGFTIVGSKRYKGFRSWDEQYYAAREVHDERIGIAKTYLYKRNFKIEYLMRAEIPGDYRVMPANVTLMYYPQVGGRSNEFKLRIMDKK